MPLFTFMGASVLRKDDAYSYAIIRRTLESIIPLVVSHYKIGAKDVFEEAASMGRSYTRE